MAGLGGSGRRVQGRAGGGVLGPSPTSIFFVRGTDDHLGHKLWNGSQWSDWEDLGGPIGSAPAVASWNPFRLEVFAAGTDGNLMQKSWNGTAWGSWVSVGGVFHDNPAAVSWGPNRVDVFIRGMDSHLQHLWRG